MTADQAWPLQQALYARLTDQLVGQGPGGSDIAVFDHVPRDPDRVHVRLEAFNLERGATKQTKGRHFFSVRVFDSPAGTPAGAVGQRTVKQVSAVVVAALEGWAPSITGASKIEWEGSEVDPPDPDGVSRSAESRFSIHI